jgi:hypothetical protein
MRLAYLNLSTNIKNYSDILFDKITFIFLFIIIHKITNNIVIIKIYRKYNESNKVIYHIK